MHLVPIIMKKVIELRVATRECNQLESKNVLNFFLIKEKISLQIFFWIDVIRVHLSIVMQIFLKATMNLQ